MPEMNTAEYTALIAERDALRAACERAKRLFDEALPKFNWGASFLDANAIQLLNEVPSEVAAALQGSSPTPSIQ